MKPCELRRIYTQTRDQQRDSMDSKKAATNKLGGENGDIDDDS